jgi:hypothetical protein
LTAINVFNKNNMGYTDRKFCSELAGHFLWGSVRYANPKSSTKTMNEAKEAGMSLSKMDFNHLLHVMRHGNTQTYATTSGGLLGGISGLISGVLGGTTSSIPSITTTTTSPTTTTTSTGGTTRGGVSNTTPSPVYAPSGSGVGPSSEDTMSSIGAIGAPHPDGGVVGGPFDPTSDEPYYGRRRIQPRDREDTYVRDIDFGSQLPGRYGSTRRYTPADDDEEYNEDEDSRGGRYVRDRARARVRRTDDYDSYGTPLESDLDEGSDFGPSQESTYSGSESGNSINFWT